MTHAHRPDRSRTTTGASRTTCRGWYAAGPDILSESGVVRSDLASSFGSASGVAEGVPLTVRLSSRG